MFVRLGTDPIDRAAALGMLSGMDGRAGALVEFSGFVRGEAQDMLTLEHYPGMTEKMMNKIAQRAIERFDLVDAAIWHRVGPMAQGVQIVWVAACAPHRKAAFLGASFIMDYLKTRAPFWKKDANGVWVAAQESDEDAFQAWGEDVLP